MRIDRCTVLLTGATGGIGSETARALVAAGARVLLVARDASRLDALACSIGAPRARVITLAADVAGATGRAAVSAAAAAARVDTLVNNAALPSFGALDELDESHIAEVVATNLIAPMQLVRLLLPRLRTLPQAAILNVGSTLGRVGVPGFSVYAASKFGLRGFTETLRRELAGTRVNVQYLAPRTTRTAFNSERVARYNAATGAREDSPASVACELIRMLVRGGAERHLGRQERLAVRLNGVAPNLLDRAFRRHAALLDAGASAPSTPVSTSTIISTERSFR